MELLAGPWGAAGCVLRRQASSSATQRANWQEQIAELHDCAVLILAHLKQVLPCPHGAVWLT